MARLRQSVFASSIPKQFVTEFDKTRLPHASNSSTSISRNFMFYPAIDLEFSHNCLYKIAGENLKLMAYFCLELWIFKPVKLDVCGILVLSNSVTFIKSCKCVTLGLLLCYHLHFTYISIPPAIIINNTINKVSHRYFIIVIGSIWFRWHTIFDDFLDFTFI